MELFKIRRTIPFMRFAKIFNAISLISFIVAVAFLIIKGLSFSIESAIRSKRMWVLRQPFKTSVRLVT